MSWTVTVTAAALCLALTTAAGAQGFPPGMGLDEAAEKRLEASLSKLVTFVGAETLDHKAMAAELAAARKDAAALVALAEKTKGAAPDEPTLPARVPVALLGGAAAERVRALWTDQLKMNVLAAHGMLTGERQAVREWIGWSSSRDRANRARPVADALREAHKSARLLAAPTEVVRVKKGPLLFSDDFSKGADNWLQFGQCVARHEGDAFRLKDRLARHPDAMMWTKREFDGNLVAEFTFIPHSKGGRAGALFTICGRPRPGKDLSVCVGSSMNTYNYGIDGYHFSMHRGTTGLGNVRRVGPGLKMLASGPDPCPRPGRAYRVAVAKWGSTIFLHVDGKLINTYYDAATYGPVLTAGRIGIRHWAGMDASYRDFRVYRLIDAGERKMPELIAPAGKVLFEEPFKTLENWRHEGAGRMVLDAEEPGAMRLEIVGSRQGRAGSQAFCLKDFPDGIAIEYDLKVLTKNGLVITFLAMKGIKGEDMFAPEMPKREGVFGDYVRNPRLRSYHVSVSRYGDKGVHTGVSNWRRNPGLNLMGQGPDLCKEIKHWYRVRIVKDGGHCQLGVNGVLAHEFTDPGELDTPMPDSGKVGFRAIGAEVRALIRNFSVRALR